MSLPTEPSAYMLRKQKNVLQLRIKREQDKKRHFSDLQTYNLFNSMLDSYYPPQIWELTEFKHQDIKVPISLKRKERNKIFASNSRKRSKLMRNELKHRITVLESLLEPSYFMSPINSVELTPPKYTSASSTLPIV